MVGVRDPPTKEFISWSSSSGEGEEQTLSLSTRRPTFTQACVFLLRIALSQERVSVLQIVEIDIHREGRVTQM